MHSGLTYRGAPTTTISNLWHLEGETVAIYADGSVETPQVVENGAIALPVAASTVSIGLGYTARAMTLPLAVEGAEAAGVTQAVFCFWRRAAAPTTAIPASARLQVMANSPVSPMYATNKGATTLPLRLGHLAPRRAVVDLDDPAGVGVAGVVRPRHPVLDVHRAGGLLEPRGQRAQRADVP